MALDTSVTTTESLPRERFSLTSVVKRIGWRQCIECGERFMSEGAHNVVCEECHEDEDRGWK